MSLSLTVTCEKIGEIKIDSYEVSITLDKITAVDVSEYQIDELIELVGYDKILKSLGKDRCVDYFGIEEVE